MPGIECALFQLAVIEIPAGAVTSVNCGCLSDPEACCKLEDMDMTWVTDRIAVGGGIWNEIKMIEVAEAGVTHVINMQIEFDDRHLGIPYDIKILWNPTDDDFQFKPPNLLQRGVEFALEALEDPNAKIFIHCAAGVHRAPMMTLAVLRAMGWELNEATELIKKRRPVVDFADVYVRSVEAFIRGYMTELAGAE